MEHKEIKQDIQSKIANDDLGQAWLTAKVQVYTKEMVRVAKRAYSNMFETLDDDRVYWPETKKQVDSIAANLDFDLKDINIVSKQANYKGTAFLSSQLLKDNLKKRKFGLLMNEAAHQLTRDGTVLVRTYEEKGYPQSFLVDLENLWTDFGTNEPTWFIERVSIPRSYIPKSWNKDVLTAKKSSHFKESGDLNSENVVAYRYEGLMPLGYINNSDDDTEVYGLLWITGLDNDDEFYIQSRKYLGKDKSACMYDWAQFVPNSARFISVGVPEALMKIQEYLNLVINNRVKKSNIASQLTFLIRKGSGITPDMLAGMVAGGSIMVKNLKTDASVLPIPDLGSATFAEEQAINSMAQQLTGSTDVSRGQITNSGVTLGQVNREAEFSGVRFQYHKEAFAFMLVSVLEKWMKIIEKNMNNEELLKITNEKVLKEIAMAQAKVDVRNMAQNAANRFATQMGPNEELGNQVMNSPEILQQQFDKRMKQNEWKLLKDSFKDFEYKIDISINDEPVNKQLVAANITAALPLLQNLPNGQELLGPMIEKLMELSGISTLSFKS